MERTIETRSAGDTAAAIFEAIADPVLVIDFEGDGLGATFCYVNEAAGRLLKRPRRELLQMRPGTIDEISKEVMDEAYERLMAEGRATFETLMIAGDGSRVPVEIHASDAILEGRRVCISIARSLVARKELDVQMRLAKEQAEAANRAKSEFLATMSHEIRTPLHGVIGFASLLISEELPEHFREVAEGIRDSADLLQALVTDVLDFSRIEAGLLELQLAPVNLSHQLKRIYSSFRLRAEKKGLDFRYSEDTELPSLILADSVRIEQVLGNLLGNALKFTERGSVVLQVCWHTLNEDGDYEITFAVSDTGSGIQGDKVQRLFQPFSQVDASLARRHGGSGLGLVIVKRLCELMGGKVAVQSEFGKGSTFTASIRARTLAKADALLHVASGPDKEKITIRLPGILVADDNATNRRLMERMFDRLGYPAKFAQDGHEVLQIAAKEKYDLIFMDVSMPRLDGLEATRAIRAHERKTGRSPSHIIALTAGVSEEERQACSKAGMDDFLGKPFTEEKLRAVISKALVILGSGLDSVD